MPARSSEDIQGEIVGRLGFFPPFFAPAREAPELLEQLWQQTRASYLESPLPQLFREKLAALLSRHCSIPYALVCHACSLRGLGMSPAAISDLLRRPLLSLDEARDRFLATAEA